MSDLPIFTREADEQIAELEARLKAVYEAGLSGIKYVGASNYASREREAKQKLHRAMYPSALEAGDE